MSGGRRNSQLVKKILRTEALLVRRIPVGDADLIVTLFTEAKGIVSAVARSARRNPKRLVSLEPIHLLRITLEEREQKDLAVLSEAAIALPRLHLVNSLERMEAAGRALRWIRAVAPPGTREPGLFHTVNELLDTLNDRDTDQTPEMALATAGLQMLADMGFGLVLERCVRCGSAAVGTCQDCSRTDAEVCGGTGTGDTCTRNNTLDDMCLSPGKAYNCPPDQDPPASFGACEHSDVSGLYCCGGAAANSCVADGVDQLCMDSPTHGRHYICMPPDVPTGDCVPSIDDAYCCAS